jgi:hypothetical protein
MRAADPTDTLAALERLREEVMSLTEQQSEALKDAIYLGMTPAQAKAYDERRKRITRLMQDISVLQQAH